MTFNVSEYFFMIIFSTNRQKKEEKIKQKSIKCGAIEWSRGETDGRTERWTHR